MTHAHVPWLILSHWHDLFVRDMTRPLCALHSYRRLYLILVYTQRDSCKCAMTHPISLTWPIHTRHDLSSLHVTLIYVCMWDSNIRNVTHAHVIRLDFRCESCHKWMSHVTNASGRQHDMTHSFVTWLICDMTRRRVWVVSAWVYSKKQVVGNMTRLIYLW